MKALRVLVWLAALQIAQTVLPFGAVAMDGLKTVPYVDPAKYIGVWYQIAHKPQWFEFGGVCACSRQKLSQGNNGVLNVYNSCNENNPSGKLKEVRGIAKNEEPTSNSKFSVDFNLPWKGTYWIIALDADYRWAVVSDENAMTTYIISKTPTLAPELYKEAFAQAAQQMDVSEVKMTYQQNCTYPQ